MLGKFSTFSLLKFININGEIYTKEVENKQQNHFTGKYCIGLIEEPMFPPRVYFSEILSNKEESDKYHDYVPTESGALIGGCGS